LQVRGYFWPICEVLSDPGRMPTLVRVFAGTQPPWW
jgi:hypothetical protein